MMRRARRLLYALSERLGVEIYAVGVGRRIFLPMQRSGPHHVDTIPGALAAWIVAAIEHPDEPVWWMHTHPFQPPFFSASDVEGAHRLWYALGGRPFWAFIVGDKTTLRARIDDLWIAAHPRPRPWGALAQAPKPARSNVSSFPDARMQTDLFAWWRSVHNPKGRT